MKRTYGRRNSRRTQPVVEDTFPPPRKRPKIEVEIVPPTQSSLSPSISPPRVTSPIRRNATLPDVGSTSSVPSSVHTPTKPARDLSTLFPTSPHRTPSSPGISLGVAKRMLSRSRTESSIDRNASHNLCSSTPSSSTFPANRSSPKRAPSGSPIPTPSKLPPTKHARTYAGASRSYLIALPAADLAAPEDMRESYSDLRSRWGVDNSEDDPRSFDDDTQLKRAHSSLLLSNGMMNDLKSITELRSKGESRRFLDEVGYLFEGIEAGCATALRRASVLEIVSKLCDLDFNRRAKMSDFYSRTWDVFIKARGEGPDKVLDATLSFFAFFSTRDPQTISELAHKHDFVPTLFDILRSFTPASDVEGYGLNQGLRKDILALALLGLDATGLKAAGIIRTDVAPLKALADVIAKSGVVKNVRGLSIRTLLSTTLTSLPICFLPPALQTLPPILHSLRAELRLVPPRVRAWERGLELFPVVSGAGPGTDEDAVRNGKGKERQKLSIDITTPSLAHIHACLRLLDTYLLEEYCSPVSNGTYDGREEGPEIHCALVDEVLLDDLVELCVATEILVRDYVRDLDIVAMDNELGNGGVDGAEQDFQEGCEGELARKTLFSTLRILTLLPASAPSHSNHSSSYSYHSPTHTDTIWTPSNAALSLVMRVVLRAQAGWVGSLHGIRAGEEGEQTQGDEDYTAKTKRLEDSDTPFLPPSGSPHEPASSTQKQAPSSPRFVQKKMLSVGSNVSNKISRTGASNEGNWGKMLNKSTPSQGNGRGKGQRRVISVPAYSLTCVESFDLLCLALGLLLNWTSGGGETVSERMGRVLLNPACSATRNCAHACSCSPSSQISLLSCLASVYQSYRGMDSLLRKGNIFSDHARNSVEDVDRKPSCTSQKRTFPSASRPYPSTFSPNPPLPKPKSSFLNTPSLPPFQSPEISFLAGYTAVLLGLTYTSTPSRTLNNQSPVLGDVSLEALIVDARNFLALYDNIEGELNDEGNFMDADGGLDLDVGSDADGQCNMGLGKGRGKALEKRNEDIARGVLETLEALWDEEL